MSEDASPEPFTLLDAFVDGWRALVRGWAVHLGAAVLFTGASTVICCVVTLGTVVVAVPLGLDVDEHGRRDGASTPMLVALSIACSLAGYVLLLAHEAITLHATHVAARGERPRLRDAIATVLRRAPAIAGAGFARLVIDALPPAVMIAVGAVVLAAVERTAGDTELVRAATAVLATLGYFAWLAWLLVARAHVGLVVSIAVRDGGSAREALASSRRLLAGRRAHFALYRFIGFAGELIAYCVVFVPTFLVLGLSAERVGPGPSDATTAIGAAILVLVYGLFGVLVLIDTVLVGAYHARVAKPVDATTLAKIFE